MEKFRAIKSYVTREGRMTPGQKRALQDLWPEYGIELTEDRDSLFTSFPTNALSDSKRILEIGFGMGDSLFETACLNSDKLYIGVEPHRPGVGHILQLTEAQALYNLKVVCADAIEVLKNHIPDDSLDIIQVFFPDPWPKKRHHKRRLINSAFFKLSVNKVKVGGKILIATDWENYANSIIRAADANSCIEACDSEKRSRTKYEKRGERLGHNIIDLAYIRSK